MPLTERDKELIIRLSLKVNDLQNFVPDKDARNAMSIVVFTSDGETDDNESVHVGDVAAIAYNLSKTVVRLLLDVGMTGPAIIDSFGLVASYEITRHLFGEWDSHF